MAKSGIKITTIKREVKPEDVGRKAIFPYSVNDAYVRKYMDGKKQLDEGER